MLRAELIRKFFIVSFVCAVLAVAGAAAWVWRPLSLEAPLRLKIPSGAGVVEASRIVADATHLSRWPMRWLMSWRVPPQRLRAGYYDLAPGMTPLDIASKFARGEIVLAQITIIEGWTFAQMRAALVKSGAVQVDVSSLDDLALMKRIGSEASMPEGWFMPDTYKFALGASDVSVYKLAHQAMRQALADAWAKRAADLPLKSMNEALILASIIEKETGAPGDRRKVAAVFINRLRIGMKLQTDPTVIYGLGARFDGKIYQRDLVGDTPYNTYVHDGLPPTPIALPGRASIEAALHPDDTGALYFVARGDGSSEFSETLAAHNRAVAKYRQRP